MTNTATAGAVLVALGVIVAATSIIPGIRSVVFIIKAKRRDPFGYRAGVYWLECSRISMHALILSAAGAALAHAGTILINVGGAQ